MATANTNSPLISYTKRSPNHSGKRTHVIDVITIHCMAGNLSVESCGALFANASREASSNYGIGSDGRIALYVDEANRSWCTSSRENDQRAVTIEVANNGGAPDWPVSAKAYEALLDLVTDICKRNGITRLLWKADKGLIGQVGKQNMTAHRWFAAKACPGDYLYNRFGAIAEEVNRRLGSSVMPEPDPAPAGELYRVRKAWVDAASQIGAFKELDNAKRYADAHPGYAVYDSTGKQVYPVAEFKPYLVRVTTDSLRIRKEAGTNSAIVGAINDGGIYTIVAESDGPGADKWGKLKSGAGWIALDFTAKI